MVNLGRLKLKLKLRIQIIKLKAAIKQRESQGLKATKRQIRGLRMVTFKLNFIKRGESVAKLVAQTKLLNSLFRKKKKKIKRRRK